MKKSKGFTLVEVLGTIVILGVIALIAVPMVSTSRDKINKAYYENMTYLVKIAGQDYYSDNRSLLPIEQGSKGVVNLKQLEQLKYIDSVVSTNKNKCEGYVEVSKKNGYQYNACLKCDNFISDKNCNFPTSGGGSSTSPNSTYLLVNPINFEVERGKAFIPPYASYYVDGTLVRSDIGATPSQVDTNILTTYTMQYNYKNAAPVEIKVKVIDVTPPSAVSVVQKKVSTTGAVYTGGWTNSDIYQIFSATDDSSGVKGYEYSFTNNPSNNSLWTFTSNNNITQKNLLAKLGSSSKDIHTTVYVRAVDNYGNKGVVSGYSLAVDQTPPQMISVNLRKSNGSLHASGYVSELPVTIEQNATDSSSGVSKYVLSYNGAAPFADMTKNWYISWDGSWNMYIKAIDNAGNMSANTVGITLIIQQNVFVLDGGDTRDSITGGWRAETYGSDGCYGTEMVRNNGMGLEGRSFCSNVGGNSCFRWFTRVPVDVTGYTKVEVIAGTRFVQHSCYFDGVTYGGATFKVGNKRFALGNGTQVYDISGLSGPQYFEYSTCAGTCTYSQSILNRVRLLR